MARGCLVPPTSRQAHELPKHGKLWPVRRPAEQDGRRGNAEKKKEAMGNDLSVQTDGALERREMAEQTSYER